MLINRSNLHNYFSDFFFIFGPKTASKRPKKRRKMRGEDLRIIAMTCVGNQRNIIGIKLKIYKFYYPKKKTSSRNVLLVIHIN